MSRYSSPRAGDGKEYAGGGRLKWIVGAIVGGALAWIGSGFMQSTHQWMCGWARGPAGWLSDCAAYSNRSTQTVIIKEAASSASSDPLEVLTRRGYSPDPISLYRAISLDRKEDVELHLKAGVKMDTPIPYVKVSPEVWQFLVKSRAVEEPCEFSLKDVRKHEYLLRGALANNAAIYRNLCGGKYVAAVKSTLAKAKADHEKRLIEARAAIAKRDASLGRALETCRSGLDAAFQNSSQLKDRFVCAAWKTDTEERRLTRAAACARAMPLEQASKALEERLRALGHLSATPFNPGYDCLTHAYCMKGAATKVGGAYYEHVVRDKQPEAGAAWRSLRAETIEKHCVEFFQESYDSVYRDKTELPKFLHADFLASFEKVMAEGGRASGGDVTTGGPSALEAIEQMYRPRK